MWKKRLGKHLYSTISPRGSCQDKVTLNFWSMNLHQTCCAQARNKKYSRFVLSVWHIAPLHNRPPKGQRLSRLVRERKRKEKRKRRATSKHTDTYTQNNTLSRKRVSTAQLWC